MTDPMQRLHDILAAKTLTGTFASLGDPVVPRILARAGFDVLVFDAEHYPVRNQLLSLVTAAAASGVRSLVRIETGRREYIQLALETGADGILVPMVESPQEAEACVSFSRYPPVGTRGYHGLTPASAFSGGASYIERANASVFVALQIETKRGWEASREICSVPGVDMIFIGFADLCVSMGLPGQYEHPSVLAAADDILGAAKENGKLTGIFAASPGIRGRYSRENLVVAGSDITALLSGAAQLRSPPQGA
ncbi:MAG: 4-hydroxy-2-oxo-heptane-1,7-dioate aldolase [Spirochaetia bacterium]|nr:4-hydroxy-2-oxo-heptane-1,7-dioate aldolase [Spirochaetia bacterium]